MLYSTNSNTAFELQSQLSKLICSINDLAVETSVLNIMSDIAMIHKDPDKPDYLEKNKFPTAQRMCLTMWIRLQNARLRQMPEIDEMPKIAETDPEEIELHGFVEFIAAFSEDKPAVSSTTKLESQMALDTIPRHPTADDISCICGGEQCICGRRDDPIAAATAQTDDLDFGSLSIATDLIYEVQGSTRDQYEPSTLSNLGQIPNCFGPEMTKKAQSRISRPNRHLTSTMDGIIMQMGCFAKCHQSMIMVIPTEPGGKL